MEVRGKLYFCLHSVFRTFKNSGHWHGLNNYFPEAFMRYLWSLQFCALASYWSTGWTDERTGPPTGIAFLGKLSWFFEVDNCADIRKLNNWWCIVNAMAGSISCSFWHTHVGSKIGMTPAVKGEIKLNGFQLHKKKEYLQEERGKAGTTMGHVTPFQFTVISSPVPMTTTLIWP